MTDDAAPVDPPATVDAAQAIRIAEAALEGVLTPRAGAQVTVRRSGGAWEVEWSVPPQPTPVRGPDFEARVTVDVRSGEVISVLAGS